MSFPAILTGMDSLLRQSLFHLIDPHLHLRPGAFAPEVRATFRSPRRAFATAGRAPFFFWLHGTRASSSNGAPISFRARPVLFQVLHNQFFVMPRQLSADLQRYLFSAKPSCSRSKPRSPAAQKKSSASLSPLSFCWGATPCALPNLFSFNF